MADKKFELRTGVVYKRRIYTPGDEKFMPDELVETMTKRYLAADAPNEIVYDFDELVAAEKEKRPAKPIKKPTTAKAGEK